VSEISINQAVCAKRVELG